MRTVISCLVAVVMLVAVQVSNGQGWTDEINSNVTGYVYIPVATTNFTETSLATGTAYVCWPLADFFSGSLDANYASENGVSSSYRRLVYAISKTVEDYITGLAASNRPTYLTVKESIGGSGANVSFTHRFTTILDRDGDLIAEP